MSAKYFRDLNFSLPTFSNPADTYMRILAVNFPKAEKDNRKLAYFNANYDKNLKPFVENERKMLTLAEPDLKQVRSSGVSVYLQFVELVKRNKKGVARDPMQTKAKIGQQLVFSLIVLAIFFDIGFQNEGGLDEKVDFDGTPQR